MSRHGYSEDGWDDAESQWRSIRWQGAVKSAIRGKRGQAFLRELVAALDAMPVKELGAGALVDRTGCPCAMGAVALARGLPVEQQPPADPDDYDPDWDDDSGEDAQYAAELLGIARTMGCEIAYQNDDEGVATPAQRWERMRRWAVRQIAEPQP